MGRRACVVLCLWPLLLFSQKAESAATPRAHAYLQGGQVRLSDLFSGLTSDQDCEIGPAPDLGHRIVVLQPQLAAIASQFGVDWQPSSGYAQVILERRARTVTKEQVLAALRPMLAAPGIGADDDVALAPYTAPLLPADSSITPDVQDFDLDPETKRFSALLQFPGSDSGTVALRVAGRAVQLEYAVALTRSLPRGTILQAGDVTGMRVPAVGRRNMALTAPQDAIGLALKQTGTSGALLTSDMLMRPTMIARGRPVLLRLQVAGVVLTVSGCALESGAEGQFIHVLNTLSRAIIVGQIINGNEVTVDPGSVPVSAPPTLQGTTLANAAGLPSMNAALLDLSQDAFSR